MPGGTANQPKRERQVEVKTTEMRNTEQGPPSVHGGPAADRMPDSGETDGPVARPPSPVHLIRQPAEGQARTWCDRWPTDRVPCGHGLVGHVDRMTCHMCRLAWVEEREAEISRTLCHSSEFRVVVDAVDRDEPGDLGSYAQLRGRFGHGLQGVAAWALDRVAAMVAEVCRAIEANDGQALERAATMAELASAWTDEPDQEAKSGAFVARARLRHALAGCEAAIERAREPDGLSEAEAFWIAWGVVGGAPELAQDGIGEFLRKRATELATAPTNRGRGRKRAIGLLQEVIERAGLDVDRRQIKYALEKKT